MKTNLTLAKLYREGNVQVLFKLHLRNAMQFVQTKSKILYLEDIHILKCMLSRICSCQHVEYIHVHTLHFYSTLRPNLIC